MSYDLLGQNDFSILIEFTHNFCHKVFVMWVGLSHLRVGTIGEKYADIFLSTTHVMETLENLHYLIY